MPRKRELRTRTLFRFNTIVQRRRINVFMNLRNRGEKKNKLNENNVRAEGHCCNAVTRFPP